MRFTLLASLLLGATKAILVPSDPGPFSVAMRVKALTDHKRTDPFNNTAQRRVLLSVFWPVPASTKCSNDVVPYMSPATAASYGPLAKLAGLPENLFSSFELEFCGLPKNGGCRANRRAPQFSLVLFSPGLGESRLLYSVTAKSIAAQGYVVVTADHPYEADVVEFPDGSVVLGNRTEGMEQQMTEIRAADISFTLTELRQLSPKDPIFQNVPAKIDFTQIIAMGHSFGGAAAALALRDRRIRGGINLDGRLFNPVLETGTDQPLMLLGRDKHADEDPTWNQFWRVLRGPKAMVGVAGTTHSSFTDIPALIQALGLPEEARARVEAMLGSVGGGRMQEIVARLSSSFFSWVLKRDHGALADVVDDFPEVSVKKSSFKGV